MRGDRSVFSIRADGQPVGCVVLHDIDREKRSALVAYHVFETVHRDRRAGTMALRLLQDLVRAEGFVDELVVTTSADNVPSQRLATTCGFALRGPPREDPDGRCFVWTTS